MPCLQSIFALAEFGSKENIRGISMLIELADEEVETLLESLDYSKHHVSAAQGTPQDVRADKLRRLETLLIKLRNPLESQRRGAANRSD